MQTVICRPAVGSAVCFVASVLAFTATCVSAQVNSWINPTSDRWDQASNWSLGILPGNSQSVMITNSGWKAVAIYPSTPVNFPGSMTVSNLTLRGAWDTQNLLLLNYFGTAVPLTVLNGLTLQDGAHILNLNSSLVVQAGTITVTNSDLVQDGGFVRTTNAPIYLQNAVYQLTNGVFEGGQVSLGFPVPAQFNQYGGTAAISALEFGRGSSGAGGTYALYGGNLSLPNGLIIHGDNNASSAYFQADGTNRTTSVSLEAGLFGISPQFTLNGGLLADSDVSLIGDDFGGITITQNGGTHVITNALNLLGGAHNPAAPHPAVYQLNGGTLAAHALNLDATFGDAALNQTNGIAQVGQIQAHASGSQTYFTTTVNLSGGSLTCSNLFVTDGGNILQSGGGLTVSNLLGFGGYREPGPRIYTRYTLLNGTLTASNIDVGGDWIIGNSSGTNRISNPGSVSLSHTLVISNAVEQLGRFILVSNATINLAGSASRLSFDNSSGENWSAAAMLLVSNWNGTLSGGGAEQLRFGTDQSGLTPAQLSQIRFGTGTNLFLAKILNTGEVVPDQATGPSITFSTQGNTLVLTWPQGWSLQTATNVPGPYLSIPGAASPYTNNMALDPQRFFRLAL